MGQRQRKVAGPLFDLRGDLVQAVQGVEAAAAGALHDAIVRSLARRRQVATAQVNARNGRSGVQRAERFAHGLRQRAVAQQHVQRFVGAAQAGQRGAQVGHVHLLQARHGAVFGDGHGLAAVLDGSLERLARRFTVAGGLALLGDLKLARSDIAQGQRFLPARGQLQTRLQRALVPVQRSLRIVQRAVDRAQPVGGVEEQVRVTTFQCGGQGRLQLAQGAFAIACAPGNQRRNRGHAGTEQGVAGFLRQRVGGNDMAQRQRVIGVPVGQRGGQFVRAHELRLQARGPGAGHGLFGQRAGPLMVFVVQGCDGLRQEGVNVLRGDAHGLVKTAVAWGWRRQSIFNPSDLRFGSGRAGGVAKGPMFRALRGRASIEKGRQCRPSCGSADLLRS